MKSRTAFHVVAISPLLLALSACGNRSAPSTAQAKPEIAVPVSVGKVIEKPEPLVLRGIGNVQPYNTVQIKAQVGGELIGVHFKDGDYVRRGQLLFTIDPAPYEAALRQAEANRQRDAAQAASARADAQRYANLAARGIISQQQAQQSEATAQASSATVAADEAAIQTARLQLSYTRITSPIDGRTGAVLVQRGNLIKANDVPMVVIDQVQPIYVAFAVPGQNLDEIRRYMAKHPLGVEAVPNDGGTPQTGTLTFVDNNIDVNTGTIQLKATYPNGNRALWPGEFVTASLTLSVHPSIVVPSPAVQNSQQGQYVYVVKPDMRVESRPIAIDRTIGQDTIIKSGLQPGETVVTDGQLRLVPGAKVAIAPPVAPAGSTES